MEGYRWVYSGRGAWGGMVALSCTGSTAGHSFTSSFFHPFSSSFTHGHPTASGHLLSCQTLRSIYRGPWPLPSHLWVSLCETEPSPTGHWMDLCIPQAKIVYNRGKCVWLPVLPLAPLPRASKDSSQELSQHPSPVLDNVAWRGSLPAPQDCSPWLLQSFPTMGFPAAMPTLSPSPPGGSSSCLAERLCEQGLQQLRLSPAVLLTLSTKPDTMPGRACPLSELHSQQTRTQLPQEEPRWAAGTLGPRWKAQGSQGPGWEPSE